MSLNKQANFIKNNEVLASNGGEKERKRIQFSSLFRKQHATLENDTLSHLYLGWEILCLKLNQTTLKVFIRFLGIRFRSNAAKPSAVSLCVQEIVKINHSLQTFVSIHVDHP